jgi:hypothetical protein
VSDRRGRVRVSADLLKALLRLPDEAAVDFAAYDPETRVVELYVSGHEGLPLTYPGSHVTNVVPTHETHPVLGVFFKGWKY